MRLFLAPAGVLFGALVSTTVLAQEADTTTVTDYDVISAPALPSNKIKNEVLIEMAMAGSRLVAVGAHGNVIYKDDENWVQADVDTSVLLTSVAFADDTTGWATGHHGVIIKTLDGGKTWQRQLDGFQLMALEKRYFQQQIAAVEKQLTETDDANERSDLEWQLEDLNFQIRNIEVAEEEGPSKPFLDVFAQDKNTVMAIGAYGTFLKSSDGGEQWTVISGQLDNPNGYHLNAIFGNENHLYIVGEAGLVFSSNDGGEHWETLNSPYHGSLFGGHLDQKGRVWVYGLRGNAFVSNDKGQTFTRIDTQTGVNLSGGVAGEAGAQWLVGHSGALLEVNDELAVTHHRHPSGSVMTGIIEADNGEWVMTGRSGLLHWPAQMDNAEPVAEQGEQ